MRVHLFPSCAGSILCELLRLWSSVWICIISKLSYGALWALVGRSGGSWSALDAHGALWALVERTGTSWSVLGAHGAPVGRSGSSWSALEARGRLWTLVEGSESSGSSRGTKKHVFSRSADFECAPRPGPEHIAFPRIDNIKYNLVIKLKSAYGLQRFGLPRSK